MEATIIAAVAAIAKVAAPVLPIVIKKIQDALKEGRVREEDVELLKSQLCYIQGVIRDTRVTIKRAPDDDPSFDGLRFWAANLRCLAYDIEDLIAGHRAGTMAGAKLNAKINTIKLLVDFINSHSEYTTGPNEASRQRAASSSTSRAHITHSSPKMQRDFPLADLVGKEENLRELLDLVRRPGTPNDLNLKVMVISVVGFGGIGETTLCQRVFSDVQGYDKFFLTAIVDAAGKDDRTVLEEIIDQFRKKYDPQDSLTNRLLQKVHLQDPKDKVQNYIDRHLQEQRYFIVVYNVESEELVKFIASAFPESKMGSRIIMGMMTAVGKDAESCVGYMPKMRPLQDEQSVICFLNKASLQEPTFIGFHEQDYSPCCLQKICDGVPLALVSVCEVRGRSIPAAAVEEACRELRILEEDRWPHRMPMALRNSYDSLHIPSAGGSFENQYIPYLQACLLYFSMFPRGHVIKRGSLMRQWQAEGLQFVGNGIHADENLETLVDRNFIWPLHVTMNNNQHQHAKTCRLPRVVLDYISDMSKREAFILKTCPSGDSTTNCNRRLSLHRPEQGETNEPSVITNGSVPPRLRTLAVSWGQQDASKIADCELLRVLDLQSYPGLKATQLTEICKKLKLLKYLSLRPDTITEVPRSISNLQCLETLEFGQDNVVLLPIEAIMLPRIRHLIGKFKLIDSWHKIPNRAWVRVPKAIKESNLQRLSGFVTRRGQGFPPLMCHMRKLRKVKIWFYSDAVAKSLEGHLPKAITKFLKNDDVHRSLSLDFQEKCPSPKELLESSLNTASGKLYSLNLSGKTLSRIDLCVITTNNNTNLTGITKLCLSNWETIKLDAAFLNELSNLSQLKYLKLDAEKIEGPYDDNAPAGNNQKKAIIETGHISNLQWMCLVAKEALPHIEVNPTALQQLVSLHLFSKRADYCPSANIICRANVQADAPLKNLKEVALNGTVLEHLRYPWQLSWHEAAKGHPNRPEIRFVEHPNREG